MSTLHTLWDYHKLKYACIEWTPRRLASKRNFASFIELILEFSSKMNHAELSLCCIIIWRVWFLRNSSLHDGTKQNISDVFWWSKNYAAELQHLNATRVDRPRRDNNQFLKWNPPKVGSFKINCNAIVDAGGRRIGIGIFLVSGLKYVKTGPGLTINYVPRAANLAAHGLAKNALIISEDTFWMEEYPNCINRVVEADKPF
ncbi:hypothetical protein Dsin_008137 [Dipteronia sinensis]|uniref:RNase H type-1 domain-containing protein n=1 Tax=Dipteronia sinensis TaxID=43782 RepID=A0AAE0B2X4_9ROSI|nr:hypothetical protein Dsin_008137 [Dipteronia sinensis]